MARLLDLSVVPPPPPPSFSFSPRPRPRPRLAVLAVVALVALVALVASAGCLADADDAASTRAQALGGKCPSHICGMNGELTDGFFHELNLDGVANADGYALTGVRHDGNLYRLEVIDGRLRARLELGKVGAPTLLTGSALVGLGLRLRRIVDGQARYSTLSIASVARSTDYWARRTDGAPTAAIETYRFELRADGAPLVFPLCQGGAVHADPSSPVRPMPYRHALVFEGDRIDADQLTIGPVLNDRWFTFGCAESALAKLHLSGHTQAAQAAGFSNTIPERQTLLKLITADYCGVGASFTVAGQPLRWTDDDGTLTASSIAKVLEARWTPSGASCLSTPRVLAHPTAESEAELANVEQLIAQACAIRGLPRPPPCGTFGAVHHLYSWNPTPFTD